MMFKNYIANKNHCYKVLFVSENKIFFFFVFPKEEFPSNSREWLLTALPNKRSLRENKYYLLVEAWSDTLLPKGEKKGERKAKEKQKKGLKNLTNDWPPISTIPKQSPSWLEETGLEDNGEEEYS